MKIKHFIHIDSGLIRLLPAAYDGGIYRPVKKKQANPFIVSDLIMNEPKTVCDEYSDLPVTGKNAFMVFFGKFIILII